MVNKVRTIDFLPEIFRTSTNRQFLGASLDLLTSQPDFKRVEGFIGERYGYSIEPKDRYVVEPTKFRRDYQLDPGVIFLKPDTQVAQDFINYPGIIKALEHEGANVTNHDRLFESEFYSWDPFVDYDKIVNYAEYYWIPNGPDAVTVSSTLVYASATYTVADDDNGYVFSEVQGTNPSISLLRGGTYTFVVPAGNTEFWIQTVPGVAATAAQRTIPGVTNNGTSNGAITFTVPDTVTLVNPVLYYQSESDPNSVGILNLIESNVDNTIFISDIVGKKTYTSPNGIRFTNGLKIKFQTDVFPGSYQNNTYYVDGVGSSIVLLPVDNFIAAEITGETIYNTWSMDPWDIETWSEQLYVPVTPEYITVSRNSRDYNAWTRSNRWFHQDVLDVTTAALGYVTLRRTNKVTRAQRPIIEYRGNLKLFNSGVEGIGYVNVLDTNINDAFSEIEGKTLAQIGVVDGLPLFDTARIIFAADTNPLVRQNVYTVTLVPTSEFGVNVVHLVPDTSITVDNNSQVVVLWVQGLNSAGTTWWFNSIDVKWYQGQKKTILNQYPLYDVFDSNGNSLGDPTYYGATTFNGTKLFSYTPGDGPDDPVLGFPISYNNPATIGDILFTVNFNTETFNYNQADNVFTKNVNIGFVRDYVTQTAWNNLSGWIQAAGPSFQYQVFEFPEIKNLNYSLSNTIVTVETGGTGYAVGDILTVAGNLLGGKTPENDLQFKVSSVAAGAITGIDTSTISGDSIDVNQIFNDLQVKSATGVGSSATVSVVITGPGTTTFVCDVLAKEYPSETSWNPVAVYYNDVALDSSEYTVSNDQTDHTTSVTVTSEVGAKITVLLISSDISKTAYYQTPVNLENNPFNTDITSVAVGDMKNQYRTICTNAPGVTGQVFGVNNVHDLGNLNKYGSAIIQTSASLVLPGLFLRKQELNLFNSLKYNSDQYEIYKTLIVNLAASVDYNVYMQPSTILDDIIYNISTTRSNESAFFWTDMVPSGNPYRTNTYNFTGDIPTATFSLSPEIWSSDLYTTANYKGVAVYLTRKVSGKNTTIQLLRDADYTVSTTPNNPQLTVNYDILPGDSITVKEYNQTYGSYCPYTPSKLGLYPIFIPAVVQLIDSSSYFIRGHDGSLTKLWGSYTVDQASGIGILDDFRDQALLEFEQRVYNNFKVAGAVPLVGADVVPGQYRSTDYSRNEILDIYSTKFLDWIGSARLDYKTQRYIQGNKWTYNYNQSSNKTTGEKIIQGYWKGLYTWLYDTVNVSTAPWEMLGMAIKPTWWDSRYGTGPYTSGNTYMWQEISEGYIWNDGQPYVNPLYVRPGLMDVIPVDTYGNLKTPFDVVVGNYAALTFNNDWIVGDGAPVEQTYLTSSSWPFDLMRLLALTKPAKFFNLFADRDKYKWNDTALTPGQYLYNGRYHLDPRTLEIYGDGTAKHSYINWVVDYNINRGANGYEVVTTYLKNLDVRLTYSIAGFSAKNYLKFLIEKATPNSRNSSLLIPDENYSILLYDNPPDETIVYSSVIVQKTDTGWTLWGNSGSRNYFTAAVPKSGNYKTFSVNGASVQISQEYYTDKTYTVPYGTIFYSMQAVSQFLQNYGEYLLRQGVLFPNIIDGIPYNWTRMVEEFIGWAQQSWETGSLIALNPNAREFSVNREGLVPQPLTIQQQNFLLNQNLLPIQSQDMAINREGCALEIKVLSPADTIAYANINLSSIEHAVVFDNLTSFNDVIYNLVTGLRQPRLLMQGYKTSEWSGYINTSGFILNEDNVQDWKPNIKWPKNIIVKHKSNYYTATKLIEPAQIFNPADWLETDYDQIKGGLLPNPSTNAYEAQYYYDTNRANLENDVDLLSFSLIGFRPREYMAAADLSDITQVNVYKNIVRLKGTKLLVDSFKGADFDKGSIDYILEENWAIKGGDFGAVLNDNFIEAVLNQADLNGNPSLVGFADPNGTVDGVNQVIQINELINWERPPINAHFLPLKEGSYTSEVGIPAAGYVNLGDAVLQKYYFTDLNDSPDNLTNLYVGDNIWVANWKDSWGIFTATSLENQVLAAENNLNGVVTLTFANIHNLATGDLIAIINFDERINGFYAVETVPSIFSITVKLQINRAVTKITGNGTGFKLYPRRYYQASDAATTVLPYSEWSTRKIWVDYDQNSQWAVYEAGIAYKQGGVLTDASMYGLSTAYTTEVGKLVADGAGKIYRYYNGTTQIITGSGIGSKTTVAAAGIYAFCSSPDQKLVYVYRLSSTSGLLVLHQIINLAPQLATVTGPIAVSTDGQWLYITDATNQIAAVYSQSNLNYSYQFATTFTDAAVPAGSGWGSSIATSTDGVKIVIGAPYETVNTITQAGAVYVYTRRVQRFYGDGITTVFTLADAAPNNVGDVFVNSILQTNTVAVNGNDVTVYVLDPTVPSDDCGPLTLLPAPDGSIITVSTGYIEFVQRFISNSPHIGGLFGNSVDTNRYGAEVVVGVPFEVTQVDGISGVEGAVYRWTNAGQRYGVITATITPTIHTGTIFVDGFIVNYSGGIDNIRDSINDQTPTNIIATSTGNVLTITVRDDTPDVVYNVIDITGDAATLIDIGIVPYTNTQILYNHRHLNTGQFGYNVKMDERDSLLVSAVTERRTDPTTFDYTGDCLHNDTVFDNSTTSFIDSFSETGVVHLYDYLPAYNEGISNPGKYAFGQYISTQDIPDTIPNPMFGYSLTYASGLIMVGTPHWTQTTGGVAIFTSNWTPAYDCEYPRSTSWYINKQPLPIVNINAINNICLYNKISNLNLQWLDYTDPLQGKLLGAIATNLDFSSSDDPAVYSQAGIYWTEDHIGNTWLNLSTIRLLNYHQPDVNYNAKNWGKAFPGSTADVYTWIESTVVPMEYDGPGIPWSLENYNTSVTVDNSSNNLVTKYYFWVKNYPLIPPGKTLSPDVLSVYILNPSNSGISFLAPITTNIVGLYNSGEYIQATTSVLHLGYGASNTDDSKHTSWNLIREGNPTDFLPGLPTVLGSEPTSLYLKFLESFSGFDMDYNPVPDPMLPELVRYGTNFRPRQGMFINRRLALENYITYANNILITLPIVEIRDLSYLQKYSVIYDTRNYWTYVDWWAPGYNSETKAVIEVNNTNDLQALIQNQLLVSVNGTNITLHEGLIVKVKSNRYGRSEYYVYDPAGLIGWKRIGAELSTIQLKPELYGLYGWSSEPWGLVWDKDPSQEIRWTIRWLNEQCYIGDLLIERNKSLMLMFKFIQSESLEQNNYLPWLNKTSLVDVNHEIRKLLPYKKFQRDNQEFLQGFIDEVKPYHVLVKDFVYSYSGIDIYLGALTDFDLPAQYNQTTGNFQTPQLVYSPTYQPDTFTPDNIIWDNLNYKEWYNNFGLSINETEQSSQSFTLLVESISAVDLSCKLKSVYGLPVVGTIRIDDEDITYNSIDYTNNALIGLSRGTNGTTPAPHTADSQVSAYFTPVVVYNSGRGYTTPPTITAYIDTGIYPTPREVAQFTPIMASDRLIGVQVDNPGAGYAVIPEIIIESSSISDGFAAADVNILANTITITGHQFVTGDPVVYNTGVSSTSPVGLDSGTYYYVRAIDANTIALYQNYEQAIISNTSPYLHTSADDGRINLITQGTGADHTLTITARAICLTNDMPTRELSVSVKFDRVSYTAEEGVGTAAGRIEEYYAPTLSMPGKKLPILMEGVDYPNSIFLGDQFQDGWDYTPYDIYDWDGILDDPYPPVDTDLTDTAFTDSAPTDYDVVGDEFEYGYGPEELIPGWVTDTVTIIITSNDLVPDWNHTIYLNKYGEMAVFNNSGSPIADYWLTQWWYGTPGSDPLSDPTANTPLSTNTSLAAVFLRS